MGCECREGEGVVCMSGRLTMEFASVGVVGGVVFAAGENLPRSAAALVLLAPSTRL